MTRAATVAAFAGIAALLYFGISRAAPRYGSHIELRFPELERVTPEGYVYEPTDEEIAAHCARTTDPDEQARCAAYFGTIQQSTAWQDTPTLSYDESGFIDYTSPVWNDDIATNSYDQSGFIEYASPEVIADSPLVADALMARNEPSALATFFTTGYSFDAMNNPNVQAFLAMLRYAENSRALDDAARYSTLYGLKPFFDFSEHPALLGWGGVALSDAYCVGAGLSPGCVSTAAGAYQIKKSTWIWVRDKLKLPDFSPASQDAAAVFLIKNRGALPDVIAGRFYDAINRVRKEWASLPGAGYGQPERDMARLRDVYANAGGIIATV